MSIAVKLDTSGLKNLITTTPEKVDTAVRATAFQVEGLAKGASPYLTGANRNSIYTKTSQGNHGTPGDLGDVLPDADLGEAYVGPSMAYSARLEFGFIGTDSLGRHYHQAARPYMTPAAEQAQAIFTRIIGTLFK
jgi:phage gpG-like protein